ncbi:MAG: hypothetical protein RMK60_06505 [Burkholderiales bacterium]|nr:hypothetical protein [Burkholderiales bacterium]
MSDQPSLATAGFYQFRVLLYLPGGPPLGIQALLGFKDGVLEFHAPGVWITLLADQVRVKRGRRDHERQWLLAWKGEKGPAYALLTGEDDMRAMLRVAPEPLARQLRQALDAADAAMRRRMLLIVGLVALALLGLLAWIAVAATV